MATWAKVHPDWEYRRWGDAEVDEWLELTRGPWEQMGEYIAPAQIMQARSDLFRMEVLHRIGGVYADADFEARKPLDPLLDGVDCFTAWEIQDKWANMAIAGSVPGHPFTQRLLDNLSAHMDANRFVGPSSTWITGPRYITQHLDSDVTVFPARLFYPYPYTHVGRPVRYGNAYAVHHWANKRMRK
jgi:mannosyltransferase OCH1-like enzyme